MTNTKTENVEATAAQINQLTAAGCDIIRCAVPTMDAAKALKEIKKQVQIPVVADIHFDYRLAIAAMENGADKIRINPGNIGSAERVKAVVDVAKERNIPIRVGVNSGSLEKDLVEKYHGVTAEGLVESALDKVKLIEDMGYDNLVISIKSSDVMMCVKAHELIASQTDHPLHVGITEAGTIISGNIKSAIGLGLILHQGIGDTIRVSLTEAPEREIPVARLLCNYFSGREHHAPIPEANEAFYSPYTYRKRESTAVAGIGGTHRPPIRSEIPAETASLFFETDIHGIDRIPAGKIVVLTTENLNGIAEQRAAFLRMEEAGIHNPVIIKRTYREQDPEVLRVKAAADIGPLFLDGFGDGIWIEISIRRSRPKRSMP